MKYLILICAFLVSCSIANTNSDKEPIVTEVSYIEPENVTVVEFENIEYDGEKYAVINHEPYVVFQISDNNGVEFLGDFAWQFDSGAYIYFSD